MAIAIPVLDDQVAPWTLAEKFVIVKDKRIVKEVFSRHPYDDIQTLKREKVAKILIPNIGFNVKEVLAREKILAEQIEMGKSIEEVIHQL